MCAKPELETDDTQAEVIAFLSSEHTHPGGGPVDVIQTHGALVFLAGEVAIKMKRAVCYDYMDLSTFARREALLRRELELNQPVAPQIYKAVVPVTKEADGRLALNGSGDPVEWVLRMWRFPAKDELTVIADEGRFDDALAADLGESISAFHAQTPIRPMNGKTLIVDILDELDRVFATLNSYLGFYRIDQFHKSSRNELDRIAQQLEQRSADGHVRRCHGDLHLHNLVMLNGKPVPFDALEFDETLGTCDVLYDLAFLIMDLRHRTLDRAANIVLNSYLLATKGDEDTGLKTLPLFMAVRAAIRAMVLAQTAHATQSSISDEAVLYLDEALSLLSPARQMLVLVGGLSGSGKSTVAREMTPLIGVAPGAVHLRSDTERKVMRGTDLHTHLPASAYSTTARAGIYDRLFERAHNMLRTGHSVLIDATFLNTADRDRAVSIAKENKVALHCLWLDAPMEMLIARVTARHGDASDADANVVRAQFAKGTSPKDWLRISTAGTIEDTIALANATLQ